MFIVAEALSAAVNAEKKKKTIRKVEGARVSNTSNHTCQPIEIASYIANYCAQNSVFWKKSPTVALANVERYAVLHSKLRYDCNWSRIIYYNPEISDEISLNVSIVKEQQQMMRRVNIEEPHTADRSSENICEQYSAETQTTSSSMNKGN